ncbi:ATP synthase F0 subcomplex subunit OSCP atp5 [Spiromyces aspiralis]|uniref:ATP synthase F0 subcomplex subunit OSCP atp5 n=1 Tax=Spiromyces aspiralis TaxID=68401 RepID=A0ACC1HYI1_9FUNG|nr:ATP synthase F0 subcomplex subunit OSCP atp5 [Spiromyces aspiralis]
MFGALPLTRQQLARGYATAAQTGTKVPLVLFGIDGRYATALFQAAAAKKSLDTVETALSKVEGEFKKNPRLQELAASPLLTKPAKQELIKTFGKQDEITRNFFELLAENNRLAEIQNIIKSYKELMNAHRGIMTIKALDGKALNQVKSNLTKNGLIKDYKDINVINKVNPSILGGMVVEFGDYTIDMSAASKLAKLDKLLSVEGVIEYGSTIKVPDMHTRKRMMNEMVDAFLCLPGGYGTLEELLEMTTWSQLSIHKKPIVAVNTDGFYIPLQELIKNSVECK